MFAFLLVLFDFDGVTFAVVALLLFYFTGVVSYFLALALRAIKRLNFI